jgi:hypothetical protein
MPKTAPEAWPVSTGTITQGLTTAFYTPMTALNILSNAAQPAPAIALPTTGKYPVRISAIYLHVHAIAAGATSLIVRLSPDSTGDEILVPDTSATIATGITTATRGGVVYKVEVDAWLETPTVYLSVKTNAGTATLKSATIVLEKN